MGYISLSQHSQQSLKYESTLNSYFNWRKKHYLVSHTITVRMLIACNQTYGIKPPSLPLQAHCCPKRVLRWRLAGAHLRAAFQFPGSQLHSWNIKCHQEFLLTFPSLSWSAISSSWTLVPQWLNFEITLLWGFWEATHSLGYWHRLPNWSCWKKEKSRTISL